MDAKLRFSPEEMRLVTDEAWILTKNSVMEKVVRMMAELSGEYREIWGRLHWGGAVEGDVNGGRVEEGDESGGGVEEGDLNGGSVEEGDAIRDSAEERDAIGGGARFALDPGSPKISRGENYKGLPWVMLDYPRIFGREDVMAIRTMFWWGHAFMVTLHLKGKYRQQFLPVLERDWAGLAAAGFHLGISGDEWRHEHAEETYRPIAGRDDLAGEGLDFLKLSATLGIDRWSAATEVLRGWFTLLVSTLAR